MSEQQSQKRGLVSEAQKTERARDGYAPIPPSNPVAGAFGESKGHPTDQDTALQQSEKNSAGEKHD
ncbi:MAG TPA: hypothetical protein VIW64_05505 [Pyrinomonadaceae bacterium]|jgi:hypothetical protein